MTLLSDIVGPKFGLGDLTTFTIDSTDVVMRLMSIPTDDGVIDRISQDRVINHVAGDDWYSGASDRATRDLVTQSWNYMDNVTRVDMATCFLELMLVENLQQEIERKICLTSNEFKAHLLCELACEESEAPQNVIVDEWPSIENEFLAKAHKKPLLDWLQLQLELEVGKSPFPMIFIPVSQRFFISASFQLVPINYDDVESRFSEQKLREFMFKVFDEFVENISLEYSAETIKKIERASNKVS